MPTAAPLSQGEPCPASPTAVPAGTDLSDLTSVTIWCDRFDVSFGAAVLA
ncbi:DM13 domain-containing protein [Streptomyces sp. NPDC056529]